MARADVGTRHRETASASVLAPAIDEIRWRHPELRVTCAAFMGPTVCVLAESRPPSMPSLLGERVTGSPVVALVELLETGDEFVVSDVRSRVGWRSISSAFLGDETRTTAIVPLRLEGELVGFLRLDGSDGASIARSAVESLHDAAPVATLAIALEQERSYSEAHASRAEQLRASERVQGARQREVCHELQRAVDGLRQMIDQVAPRIDATARIEVEAIVRRFTASVEAAKDALTDVPSQRADRRRMQSAPCGTAPASSWSTGETRG